MQFGLRAKLIFRGVGHGGNIDLVITFCFERRYAAAIYKNCIYLTSFLSQIDRLVSFHPAFQLKIQLEKSIEDFKMLNVNSSVCANRLFPASQYSAGILNPALRLPSNRSDHSVILQRQNKIICLRSIVTDFNFGAVKLLLNLPNIALFLILSLSRKPVRESPLLS